jgi:Reverse transcriptase (RNA-dependent DNA polymerase)
LHATISKFTTGAERNLSPSFSLHLTEVLTPGDPREDLFDEAKRSEIQGLLKRGYWKVAMREEMPAGDNMMNGRFLLANKNTSTNEKMFKARFVVKGYRDKLKTRLLHDATTSQISSARLLVGLADVYGFRLFSVDVTQAYLQSAFKFMRDVYVTPTDEFELRPDQVLKLLTPMYVLSDSGGYWGATMRHHFDEDLGMTILTGDAAMFVKTIRGELSGIICSNVDDLLQAVYQRFVDLTKKTAEKFEHKAPVFEKFKYISLEFEKKGEELQVKILSSACKLMQ